MKIDLHVHSSEISQCGHIPGEKLVQLYHEHGYDAIVLTNHFNRYTADHFARLGIDDFYTHYLTRSQETAAAGAELGLLVLCGFELRFEGSDNDYLVYGLPEDLGRDYRRIFDMKPVEFGAIARERGFLFYQAHPFRDKMMIVPPECLTGIEIKNGHPRHDSRNFIAGIWAEHYHLPGIAGSDCHQLPDVGITGIECDTAVGSIEELMSVLKSGKYKII